ncbi:MAG: DUF1425 domain-containing protein [Verrucomicrobiota bacterium]
MKTQALLALAAFTLSACTQRGTPNEASGQEGVPGFEYSSPNATLAQAAQPVDVRTSIAEDGSSLKVIFSLRNSTTRQHYAKYTVVWLDGDGAPLPGAIEVARQVTLPVGVSNFSAVATSPRAKKFRIIISETSGSGRGSEK